MPSPKAQCAEIRTGKVIICGYYLNNKHRLKEVWVYGLFLSWFSLYCTVVGASYEHCFSLILWGLNSLDSVDVLTLSFSKKLPAAGNLAFIFRGNDIKWNEQCFFPKIQRAGWTTVYFDELLWHQILWAIFDQILISSLPYESSTNKKSKLQWSLITYQLEM